MKRIDVVKMSGKSIDALIDENNEIVSYLNACFVTGDDGERSITAKHDATKFTEQYKRYAEIQEVLKFNESQDRMINVAEQRAEIAKNREIILRANDGCCYVCGMDFTEVLIIHHIHPLADGGTNDLDNLAVLCPTCHAVVHKVTSDVLPQKKRYPLLRRASNYYYAWQVKRLSNIALSKRKDGLDHWEGSLLC